MQTGNGFKDRRHLAFIASLPCVICGTHPVECAHIRFGDAESGKMQALAKKPSDHWVLPLCPNCHRTGPEAQHSQSERWFWERHRINPVKLAKLLFECSGDLERGEVIARQSRRLACW